MLEKIGEAWRAEPDTRIIQLLINATYSAPGEPFAGDHYYAEDELVERGLDEMLRSDSDER